jgi:hypothetical protein
LSRANSEQMPTSARAESTHSFPWKSDCAPKSEKKSDGTPKSEKKSNGTPKSEKKSDNTPKSAEKSGLPQKFLRF